MGFSLLAPDAAFDLAPHPEAIRAELAAFGFRFAADRKAEGSTRVNLLEIGTPGDLASRLPGSKALKIKLKVDTDPPEGAEHEVRTQLVPIPFQVKLFTPPCLFAGKLHAILCRDWKRRVKGRAFHDFVWYLGKGIPAHLAHLRQRMEQSGRRERGEPLDEAELKALLEKRFGEVDFEQAKSDTLPFLRDAEALALWNGEFFVSLLDRLRTV